MDDRTAQERETIYKYKMRMDRGSLKAVRAHCVECMGGNYHDVSGCTAKQCALWLFRMGVTRPHEEEVEMWKEGL